jgi:hypothetical protein
LKLETRLTDQNTEIIKLKTEISNMKWRLDWIEEVINGLKNLFY